MTETDTNSEKTVRRHLRITNPSPWISRFAPLVKKGGTVLDLACGGGRHARHFLSLGCKVVALDRDVSSLTDLTSNDDAEVIEYDLEDGSTWPLPGRTFAGVVVSNYLYRDLFPHILDAVEAGGMLLYETFARGNEDFTRPRNPDHLLRSGELLEMIQGRMQVIAYEHGIIEKNPCPGVIQRIAAVSNLANSTRDDGEPAPLDIFPE